MYALTLDPQLGQIETPNGKVMFLQIVGVTAQEKADMLASSTADVLTGLAEHNPYSSLISPELTSLPLQEGACAPRAGSDEQRNRVQTVAQGQPRKAIGGSSSASC